MSALGLLLETAVIGAVLAAFTAVFSLIITRLVAGRSAATRADVAFVAALLPAVVVITALAAALSPSLLAVLGVPVVDHCPDHMHHPHLCVLHFAGLRPHLAVAGAAAVGVFVIRVILTVGRHVRLHFTVAALDAIGSASHDGAFPVVHLPGNARICHAVGVVRRRILVSSALPDQLSSTAWSAVHAHEVAHLRRHDPLATLVVEGALLFAPPILAGALGAAFRRSAEAACDANAAYQIGDGVVVAEGLIAAARCMREGSMLSLAAPAATEGALDARVRELLERPVATSRTPWAFAAASLVIGAIVTGTALSAETVHHALETLLFHLS